MSMCSSPKKAAAEAEAERVGGLGLPGERRVVERQLLKRVAQVRVVVGVDREQAAEHHRLDLAVAGQGLAGLLRRRRPWRGRERVADAQLRDVLDARDQIAHLARGQLFDGRHLWAEDADVVDLGLRSRRHRPDRLALAEHAVDDADVGDHAAVLIELGVEDQRARRRVRVARGRRHARDELSSTSSTPSPVLPLIFRIDSAGSPISSLTSPATRSGSAPGRSILFRQGISSRPDSTPGRCWPPSGPRRPGRRRRPAARPRTRPASARPHT